MNRCRRLLSSYATFEFRLSKADLCCEGQENQRLTRPFLFMKRSQQTIDESLKIRIRVLNKCFLLLVIASMAIASGCSSDAPAPSNTEGGGVTNMEIDQDSGT